MFNVLVPSRPLSDFFDKWPEILKTRDNFILKSMANVIIVIVKVVKLEKCSECF